MPLQTSPFLSGGAPPCRHPQAQPQPREVCPRRKPLIHSFLHAPSDAGLLSLCCLNLHLSSCRRAHVFTSSFPSPCLGPSSADTGGFSISVGDSDWQSEERFMKLTRTHLWGISQAERANLQLDSEAKLESGGWMQLQCKKESHVLSLL